MDWLRSHSVLPRTAHYELTKPSQAILRKKNKAWGITFQDFKLCYKVIVTETVWYWHKNRHTDQWNRIGSPEINSYLCGQSIHGKGVKNIKWVWTFFSTNGFGKLACHMQKNKTGPYLIPYTEINSRWIKDSNVRPKTKKTPRRKLKQ